MTCGLTLDRQGAVQVDNFLKIIDVRLGMRVLNVLQFQAGECLLLLISYGQFVLTACFVNNRAHLRELRSKVRVVRSDRFELWDGAFIWLFSRGRLD